MADRTDDSKKICNLNYLTELSHGNTAFVKEMIRIFLAEIPGEIQTLEKGIKENNYEDIQQAAHKLKSTIPFVGLNFIIEKELVEIEELATKRSEIEKIRLLFSQVKEMCAKASEELIA
jgi:HPt (histidine-containing phosphotransfer) domain-containing protein